MTRLLLALLIIAVILTALWLFGQMLAGMDEHIEERNP